MILKENVGDQMCGVSEYANTALKTYPEPADLVFLVPPRPFPDVGDTPDILLVERATIMLKDSTTENAAKIVGNA